MDDDWGGQMFIASSKHNCVERCARRFGNLRWVEARSTRVRAIALGRRGFLHGVMMVHGKRFCAAFPLLRSLNPAHFRSEEHTSELQSLMRISYAVFCLHKKKN